MASGDVHSPVVDAPASILLVTGGKDRLPDVVRVLRSVTSDVDVRSSFAERNPTKPYRLVLVYYDDLPVEDRAVIRSQFAGLAQSRLVILSRGRCRDDFVDLFGDKLLYNLVARRAMGDLGDLVVTINKLLSDDIFGLERYFSWGTKPRRFSLTRSSARTEMIAEAERFVRSLGVASRFAQQFALVVDEFLTNAFYNAPTTLDGQPRYRTAARGTEISLEPGQSIELMFASDGPRLGVSAVDPFGSLSAEQVLACLTRCFRQEADQIEEKDGGAGLGFYMVFGALSHFVINIAPGKKTEMLGLIDLGSSFKEFAGGTKSFNIFIGT